MFDYHVIIFYPQPYYTYILFYFFIISIVFAYRFITDINKRAKALLQDLNKICTDKKNLLNVKTEELKLVAERLKHCQKFAEASIAFGSETALVYSKKLIMNQVLLFFIIKHVKLFDLTCRRKKM